MVGPRLSPYIKAVELVNERLAMIKVKAKEKDLKFYQIYAPQQGRSREEKEAYMELLEENLITGENEISVLMGDFNGRVGNERDGIENIIGPHGENFRNVEGETLIDMCMRNELVIMNGFYEHKQQHKYTRYRWNQRTNAFDQRSIIDYFITTDRRIFKNIKVLPGVSLDSDHRLLVADMEIKNMKSQKAEKRIQVKTKNLQNIEMNENYRYKINDALDQMEDQADWMVIKNKILQVSKDVLGETVVGGVKKRHTPW